MLDPRARVSIQPYLDLVGALCIRRGWRPDQLTLVALGTGLAAAGLLAAGNPFWFAFFLWLSGVLDALDGTVARLGAVSSRAGALLDIVCDRVVEVAVIFAFGWLHPEAVGALLALSGAIICSLTVFLTAASALPNASTKSFHYQAGLAERTEGFLFFTLMALWPTALEVWTWIFAGVVLVTAGQRFLGAWRLLRD